MKNIVIYNGIHGAGKSTVAKETERAFSGRARYYLELGGKLRSEVDYNCLESGESFDSTLLRLETLRDRDLIAAAELPLVESWHVGNLAYVYQRSPRLIPQFMGAIETMLSSVTPFAFFINISDATFFRRFSERVAPNEVQNLLDFYRRIEEATFGIYEYFGIQNATIQNEREIGGAVSTVVKTLSNAKVTN
jgi:adenylate kinase family enzyme